MGIETSCDDTGIAIVNSKREVIENAISSQYEALRPYSGVVPIVAARQHKKNLPLLFESLYAKGFDWDSIDAIAVTQGPGLAPCLSVGLIQAKAAAVLFSKPLIAVNHLEAHVLTARLTDPEISFPFLSLLVSGGHCQLVLTKGVKNHITLGTTVDDSVGEALDKTGRILGIGFGDGGIAVGAHLEALATTGNPHAFPFTLPMPHNKSTMNFSYSGFKSAVKRHLEVNDVSEGSVRADLAASFQNRAFEHLTSRTKRAMLWCDSHSKDVKTLVVCGGVASNMCLRAMLKQVTDDGGWQLKAAPPSLCTDNGVMIAWAGHEHWNAGHVIPPDEITRSDLEIHPRWPLEDLFAG